MLIYVGGKNSFVISSQSYMCLGSLVNKIPPLYCYMAQGVKVTSINKKGKNILNFLHFNQGSAH
jgi:hypothetical protein